MKRDLLKVLLEWKTSPTRVPLILRGARQVGKSWLVREFGKTFSNIVEINFESDRRAISFFDTDLNIPEILEKLSLYTEQPIKPHETLIFFDETQECPNCIKSLRYFKEKHPEFYVIAAGSLLDFALENIGIPVGRVQFLYLHPMSFGEYLTAIHREDLRKYLLSPSSIDSSFHTIFLEHLKNYIWLGGMPEVLDSWIKHKDARACQEIQDRIIVAYKQDFSKYAKKNQIEHLETIFDFIPTHFGKKFKFSAIDNTITHYSLKKALSLLVKAGIGHMCHHSSGHVYPLGAEKDDKKFKVFFFDVGLALRNLGLNLKEWVSEPINVKILGGIAEQFVAQEYIAYSEPHKPVSLYYWHREEKNSNSEVDFLFISHGEIIPVEVKASTQGGMKSLHYFLNSHPNSSFGLKISEGFYGTQKGLKEIPLYAIEAWLKK